MWQWCGNGLVVEHGISLLSLYILVYVEVCGMLLSGLAVRVPRLRAKVIIWGRWHNTTGQHACVKQASIQPGSQEHMELQLHQHFETH